MYIHKLHKDIFYYHINLIKQMKKFIILFLLLTIIFPCAAQNSNKMKTPERFNYKYYKSKLSPNTSITEYTEEDGTVVKVSFDKDVNVIETIKPLTFKAHIKMYHKNGFLDTEGDILYCSNIRIGVWREYDKRGKLIKEENEDKKFENLKIKPKELLLWMEEKGWIDLTTGKGQQTSCMSSPFRIYFVPGKNNHAKWYIERITMYGSEDFVLDADTGELISTEKVYNRE